MVKLVAKMTFLDRGTMMEKGDSLSVDRDLADFYLAQGYVDEAGHTILEDTTSSAEAPKRKPKKGNDE